MEIHTSNLLAGKNRVIYPTLKFRLLQEILWPLEILQRNSLNGSQSGLDCLHLTFSMVINATVNECIKFVIESSNGQKRTVSFNHRLLIYVGLQNHIMIYGAYRLYDMILVDFCHSNLTVYSSRISKYNQKISDKPCVALLTINNNRIKDSFARLTFSITLNVAFFQKFSMGSDFFQSSTILNFCRFRKSA